MFERYLMWLMPLSFFAYQFVLRLWPSLMMQEIMQQFAIDATAFGLLAAVYYYGYAAMQVPIALLLDRFGARLIVALSAILCGTGVLVSIYTDSWYLSLLSRLLVGIGSAAGFLGTSKVVSEWFSKEEYAGMIGLSFTLGLLGAIYGGKPVGLLVERFGGYTVAFALGLVAICIGFASFTFLRKPAKSLNADELHTNGFKKLLSEPTLWVLSLANFLMVGALDGFADVWGVNFLKAAYGYSKSDAAELTSFIFVGMLFGGPLLAWCARIWSNYTVICLAGVLMSFSFTMLLLCPASFTWYTLAVLFFVIGLLCCYQVLVFAAGADLVPVRLLGVTVAFLNCANMLGGSFFHSIIGRLMDLFWAGGMELNVRQYTVESYTKALLIIPICAFLGSVLSLILKRKSHVLAINRAA